MGNLVGRIPGDGDGPISLGKCYEAVREAHDFLADKASEAASELSAVEGQCYWGSEAKRIKVCLPRVEWPELLSPRSEEHNLVEVINQCATIERLLDALVWAQSTESGFDGFSVERCHPTTSSHPGVESDHDLVLVEIDDEGNPTEEQAKFEVSDVSGEKDGNQKEKKDLISLGVLREGKGKEMYPDRWPEGRLFLVVSEEFAERLRKLNRGWLKGPSPYCHYTDPAVQGTTRIFEVKKGPRS